MTVCQVVQFATIEKEQADGNASFRRPVLSLLPPLRARLRPLWPCSGFHTFLFSPVLAVKGQPHRQLMPSAPIVATPGMALLCRRIERRVSLPGALSFPAGKLPQQRAEAGGCKIYKIEGGHMAESLVFNMDCMDGMRQFPDGFFDLAVVDPPYGINITGRHRSKPVHVERERERAGDANRRRRRAAIRRQRCMCTEKAKKHLRIKILSCVR